MAQRSVLIVDDDVAAGMPLEFAFRDMGWRVVRVTSAEEGLRRFSESPCDVVLTDKNLPGITGVELLRELRKRGATPVMILMTGYVSRESAMATLQLGCDGYLEKPFDDIYAVVQRVSALTDDVEGHRRRTLSTAVDHFKRATAQLQAATARPTHMAAMIATPDPSESRWLVRSIRDIVTETHVAPSVAQATEIGRRVQPHLVIMDARLGWELGLDMLRTLKSSTPSPGVVIIADDNPPLKTVTGLIEIGVHVVLSRPVEPSELRNRAISELRLVFPSLPPSAQEHRILTG